MTFTIIDHEDEARGCTTWVRCETCGGTEMVHDRREREQAIDVAHDQHGLCYACLSCGEAIGPDETSSLCHYQCRMDDPEGSQAAMEAWTKEAPTSEWLERMRDSGRRIDREIASMAL